MSLRCCYKDCVSFELANASQLAFYQDLNTGGWSFGLSLEISLEHNNLPSTFSLVSTNDAAFPYNVHCNRCHAKIGKVNAVCGFTEKTFNLAAKKVHLLQTSSCIPTAPNASKWSKHVDLFPQIRRFKATIQVLGDIVGSNTVHFHGAADFQSMVEYASAVSTKALMSPRAYQWRAYFFACLHDTLLCLPTGMGKTFIANMLMKAYRVRNPTQGQVFIVPTIVLVEQQARVIERNTGLKVTRRSGEHNVNGQSAVWSSNEICVCVHAMLLNAIKKNEVDMSQLSLLILDEVHDAYSDHSVYGKLLPYIQKCPPTMKPRVLGLTASPSGTNSNDMRSSILNLCIKLGALPYSPLDENDQQQDLQCSYISILKSPFEVRFENFVFDFQGKLSKLHDYFKANWTGIPINVSVEVSLNSVIKILSSARLIASNKGDLALFQLIQWMKKLIDSLSMLQIFGPRCLLDSIKADLSTYETDNAVSGIAAKLSPVIFEMKLAIDAMERECVIPEHSFRSEELLNILKNKRIDNERVLVFVQRRSTAERLARHLKEDPEIDRLNPLYVVGNSNGDFPKEMQQEVLEKFRKGETQVLIATSVLEQGIDIASCGVVICFDGVHSIKSIIQSRGRARKISAKFIAFVTSEKEAQTNQLKTMEVMMNYAIKQLMHEKNCVFEPQFATKMIEFLESGLVASGENELDQDEDDEEDELGDNPIELPEDKILFTLRLQQCKNKDAIETHISQFFSTQYDNIKKRSNYTEANFAVPKGDPSIGWKIMKNISDPCQKSTGKKLRVWVDMPGAVEKSLNFMTLGFDVLTGFYFEDHTTIVSDSNYIWSNRFQIEIKKNHMKLSFGDDEFYVHPMDIDGPILVNDTNHCYEVFFNLRNPPSFFVNDEMNPFDFISRPFNLFMRSNSPIDERQSKSMRAALMNLSLEVFNIVNLKRVERDCSLVPKPYNVEIPDFFIKSYMIKAWHGKYAAILPPNLSEEVLNKFFNTSSVIALELLLDATVPIRFQRLHIQNIQDVQLPFQEQAPSENFTMVGRVRVTPTRIVYQPFQPMQKCRVFRFFPNPENFLVITFADEHDGNPWRSQHVQDWFFTYIRMGITVGDKRFTFLGCSNSQLREGHCWFSCLDRQEVYEKIGDFPETMAAGRKLTRLALAFASSFETVPLDHARYIKNVAPDVEIDGVNFSDGIGRASRDLFERVKLKMKFSQPVSALQIRVGGVKGVITVYDDQTEDVVFRKSMKKFESSHNILEVLNHSFSIPLTLNRHVILMLSSFGVKNEVFFDMQHKDLMKCMDALIEDEKAFQFVRDRSKIFEWGLLPSSECTQEPFFRQILVSNTVDLVSSIVDQAKLSVPKGRILMGVLDETGTLEYGEVYAHIVEDGLDMEVEGLVLVFRMPCVLTSDIRLLKARRDVSPRVKNLYRNCLVIPSKGPASHAHECSGGDLDGDLYHVIWEKDLIPHSLKMPGYDVIEVETTKLQEIQKSTSDFDMMKFFCDYLAQNQLGIIANAHLATADKFGMKDPKTIQLARYVTAETDAPRQGYTVGKIEPKLLPTEYPDYMNKQDKQSYRSETVLGELYRHASPLLDVLLEKRIVLPPTVCFNFNQEKGSVEHFYSLYSFEIKKLLQSFELDSEVDLFSGTPIWSKGYMSKFKQQSSLRETLKETLENFWKKWKTIFTEWRMKVGNDQKMIFEWYSRPKSCVSPVHSFSFLAMPFVSFEEHHRRTLGESIHAQVTHWVNYNKMHWLTAYRARYNSGKLIMRTLVDVDCHFYGSSMLGLNEEFSDVDLYAGDENFQHLKNTLEVLDANIVVMSKPHACVSLTYESLPFDVTNFIGGVRKTYGLAETFDEIPGAWAALRTLIEWARNVNIVKSGGSQGLMTVVSFCHLFIYFITKEEPKLVDENQPYTLARFNVWIESMRDSKCGQFIFDFLKYLGNSKNKSWVATKRDPVNDEPLIQSDLIEELQKHAEIAMYILAVHDGDVQKLFEFVSKKRLFRIDKRYMDPSTITSEQKKMAMKELKVKCNVNDDPHLVIELLERNGVFFLEVTGSYKSFPTVEKGLNKIHSRIFTLRMLTKKQHAYHVKNSTMILPEFGQGLATKVSFATFESDQFQAHHAGLWKSVLSFHKNVKNDLWRSTEQRRYEDLFMKQMELFRSKQHLAQKGGRTWRFFGKLNCHISCGFHYLFNIPETLHHTFETVTLGTVERNIAQLEAALDLELQNNIVEEMKNYNRKTLLKIEPEVAERRAPLQLLPLQEMKARAAKRKNDEVVSSNSGMKSGGVRHSFYPHWMHGIERFVKFAKYNGFNEVRLDESDYYSTISVFWRQRELCVECNKSGKINEIFHRSARWFSMTMKRFEEKGGDDVRIYLKTHATLDNDDSLDESVLDTVIDLLAGRSVFNQDFIKEIENVNQETYSKRPLISEMFYLNWRFIGMRRVTPKLKMINAKGDSIILREVHDGIFRADTKDFEWFQKHYEMEIEMNLEGRSDQELCKDAYEISLKLFDQTAK